MRHWGETLDFTLYYTADTTYIWHNNNQQTSFSNDRVVFCFCFVFFNSLCINGLEFHDALFSTSTDIGLLMYFVITRLFWTDELDFVITS